MNIFRDGSPVAATVTFFTRPRLFRVYVVTVLSFGWLGSTMTFSSRPRLSCSIVWSRGSGSVRPSLLHVTEVD